MGVKEKMTRISCGIELRRRERKRSPLQAIEHFVKDPQGSGREAQQWVNEKEGGTICNASLSHWEDELQKEGVILKAGYKMNKYFAQSGDVRQGGMRGGRG